MKSWADYEAGDDSNQLELEEADWKPGQWNQFAENEKKFGVQSTYREELYTTKLDPSKLSKEQREEATRVAREIEASQAKGVQHRIERGEDVEVDEGALYSDVQRSEKMQSQQQLTLLPKSKNAYVPPDQRAKAAAASQELRGAVAAAAARSDVSIAHAKPAEGPPAPIEASQQSLPSSNPKPFNINAPAFKPSVGPPSTQQQPRIINDVLAEIAENLLLNPNIRKCGEWTGDDDRTMFDPEDDNNSQQQQQLQQQLQQQQQQSYGPAPQHYATIHHHHHHHHYHSQNVHYHHHQPPVHQPVPHQQGYGGSHNYSTHSGTLPFQTGKLPQVMAPGMPSVPFSASSSLNNVHASHQHVDPARIVGQAASRAGMTPSPKAQQPQQPVSSAPAPVAEAADPAAAPRRPQGGGFTRGAKMLSPAPRAEEAASAPSSSPSQPLQNPVGSTLAGKKKK
jgi:hypothetical protein